MNEKEKDLLLLEVSTIRADISKARNLISYAEDSCYKLIKRINEDVKG